MAFKNNTCVHWMRENLLLLLILVGVILGFLIGFLFHGDVQTSTNHPPKELAMYISFPGEIFLRMLKLIILPLIVSSVIVSLASLDKGTAAKLGRRAAVYFIITSFIAVILGIILALLLKPGVSGTKEKKTETKNLKIGHAMMDLIR